MQAPPVPCLVLTACQLVSCGVCGVLLVLVHLQLVCLLNGEHDP